MSGTALVTGASRGIGEAVAHRLADEGFRVVVTAREIEDARRVAGSLAGEGHGARALDVTSVESVAAVVGELASLDVVVNNAAAYVDCRRAGCRRTWTPPAR